MKKKLFILLCLTTLAFSSNRANVSIIEARENIQYLSQKMAIDYCLLYNKPSNLRLERQFTEDIQKLEKNILIIRNTTKNSMTSHVLNFYGISLRAIKKLPLQNPNHEHIKQILIASENFLEGTDAIDREHLYKYNKEEKMLVLTKELQFLIERATKYYIAYQTNQYYNVRLELSIKSIDEIFKKLEKYDYPRKLKSDFIKSKEMWKITKTFFKEINKTSFPNLLLNSTSYIKTLLISLEKHHKKNL